MRHGEVDGLDAVLVVEAVGDAVEAADRMRGALAELDLERPDEAVEEVEEQRIGFVQCINRGLVDQRAEHDRAHAVVDCSLANLRRALDGLVDVVHERGANLAELCLGELRKQAVSQCFCGDAGTVGDEEDGAAANVGHDVEP